MVIHTLRSQWDSLPGSSRAAEERCRSFLRREQIQCLLKWFSTSFLFSFFKWFFSGPQGQCGFDKFPSFGMKAYDSKFFFDFNLTYVGAGMICPHIVNFSLLLGGVFSWGILWPLISSRAGDWYPADATGSNLQGLYGYKVFMAICLFLGDGLYNFLNAIYMMLPALYNKGSKRYFNLPVADKDIGGDESSYDEQLRIDFFLKDSLSFKSAGLSYVDDCHALCCNNPEYL
ncbi:hypothetical protein L7F22_056517 [Adiantum nelumboides]|nr:hypothetical protein [Adiantum nelumboides]